MDLRLAHSIEDRPEAAKQDQEAAKKIIPEITIKLLLDWARQIKPVVQNEDNKKLWVVGPRDLYLTSILDGDFLWAAPPLEEIGRCKMYSEPHGGLFVPTMKEILSQIPSKYVVDTRYFKMLLTEGADEPVDGYFSIWVVLYK